MNPLAHTAHLPRAAPARVLACGAHLKNRACLIEGRRVHWSAAHGDLDDPGSRQALLQSVDLLLARAGGPVQAWAHDLHPDFFSTQLALQRAQQLGVPALSVQHHHAHIAVVLAEHGLAGPVIGLALDGMGLGTDGLAWGGEVLRVGDGAGAQHWQRLDHLPPLAQPGGDKAAREPWRLAAAVLFALQRGDEIEARFAPVVGAPAAQLLHRMLQQGLNCPLSSSAGRWFDAAAGALGLCVRQAHEVEAATALEALANDWLTTHPGWIAVPGSLALYPLVGALLAMPAQGGDAVARGAAWFHGALAAGLVQRVEVAAAAQRTRQVVLAGGCMANRVLRGLLLTGLQRAGLEAFEPQAAGCGDAGLALGQAWVAACRLSAQGLAHAMPEIAGVH